MKKKLSELAAEAWGVPKSVVMDIPRFTISGNKEIYIENHRGIQKYTDTEINVFTAMGTVKIFGKKLNITNIRTEDIFISGIFSKIEYEI